MVRAEHAVELSRTLPHARLAILPSGHGDYIGAIETANKNKKVPALVFALIEAFPDKLTAIPSRKAHFALCIR